MQARAWRQMVRRNVLPVRPRLTLTGSLLHLSPLEWLLCAAGKNDSGFSVQFTVEVFIQPLYVPADRLILSHGRRLGSLEGGAEKWWDPATEDVTSLGQDIAWRLRHSAFSFWSELGELDRFASACRRARTFEIDPNLLEAGVGAAVLLGNVQNAAKGFAFARRVKPQFGWERTVLDRVHELEQAFADAADGARNLLEERREHTLEALGLAQQAA